MRLHEGQLKSVAALQNSNLRIIFGAFRIARMIEIIHRFAKSFCRFEFEITNRHHASNDASYSLSQHIILNPFFYHNKNSRNLLQHVNNYARFLRVLITNSFSSFSFPLHSNQ